MRTTILAFTWMIAESTLAYAATPPLGSATLDVRRLAVDVDTRPDVPGLQYSGTALKDVSNGVMAVLGDGSGPSSDTIYVGAVVRAELTGPQSQCRTNARLEPLAQKGVCAGRDRNPAFPRDRASRWCPRRA